MMRLLFTSEEADECADGRVGVHSDEHVDAEHVDERADDDECAANEHAVEHSDHIDGQRAYDEIVREQVGDEQGMLLLPVLFVMSASW